MTMEISSSAILIIQCQILNKITVPNYYHLIHQEDIQWMDKQEIFKFMLIVKTYH